VSTFKPVYGSNNQSITCTFTSLTNNNARCALAIDNTSALFLDALVQVKVKSNASGTLSTGVVNVYAYGTSDGGSDYTDGVSGTDAAATLTSPTNLKLIGAINVVANATTYIGGPFSVAVAFNGVLPDHWGIVIENKSGAALDASVGSAWYQGVQAQVV
jgi:hypothetical protein